MTMLQLIKELQNLNEHIVEVKTQYTMNLSDILTNEAPYVKTIMIGFDKNIYDPWPNGLKNPDFNQKLQDNIIKLINDFYQQEKDPVYKINVTMYEVKEK